jgi:CRISPR/Cas system-associated endoribonuclease Cas2
LRSLYQYEGQISSSEFYKILKDISNFADEKHQIISMAKKSDREVVGKYDPYRYKPGRD